ncbi:uncharacterized protein MONOS_15734 [Monocercomonoides exilis]|uniref:uncharacterized protein n=1 Tax=Monocercomonoides exilis TaxID=2049356 RepID=UPI00355A7F78|nr:hypothetical protein MONOS_15734 [Monocercomonoides exilis]|eukprot:MONOS_15734.1-p1 / transcript=MONOS_15734.1 / gene=MONOS_15734 / organism=Monocercomonoides_exilis_PA203 / gene_product=unspecified product / transcript_product=unspecified product / location=Mono_scaffold01333:2820-9566(-) / protein_length=2160 / sequence_SO=supercontig / SO=protein_coding / is_pseudo=false
MSQRDDDQRSVSRSVSSDSSTANSMAVVKFDGIDHALFSLLYTLHREPRFPQIYWIICILFTIIQCVGLSVYFNKWPLAESFRRGVIEFFGYLNFSISWTNSVFSLVMTIICSVFVLCSVISVVLSSILNKRENSKFAWVSSVANYLTTLVSFLFYLPCLNTFAGNFLCVGTGKDFAEMDCERAERMAMTIISAFLALILIVYGFVVRLFLFQQNTKKGDIFACQTGIYNTLVLVLTSVMTIISVFLSGTPIVIPIVGAVCSFILFIVSFFVQPFFHPSGNALWSASWALTFWMFVMGIVAEVIDTEVTWHNVVFWIVCALGALGVPALFGLLCMKRAKSMWAMRPGESIPIVRGNKEQMMVLSSMMPQQVSNPTTSSAPTTISVSNPPISGSSNYLFGSNTASQPTPAPNPLSAYGAVVITPSSIAGSSTSSTQQSSAIAQPLIPTASGTGTGPSQGQSQPQSLLLPPTSSSSGTGAASHNSSSNTLPTVATPQPLITLPQTSSASSSSNLAPSARSESPLNPRPSTGKEEETSALHIATPSSASASVSASASSSSIGTASNAHSGAAGISGASYNMNGMPRVSAGTTLLDPMNNTPRTTPATTPSSAGVQKTSLFSSCASSVTPRQPGQQIQSPLLLSSSTPSSAGSSFSTIGQPAYPMSTLNFQGAPASSASLISPKSSRSTVQGMGQSGSHLSNVGSNVRPSSPSAAKPLLPPKKLPKYTSVSQIQYAIRYLSDRKLRKNQNTITLAETLLNIGQKKFGMSSGMWMTVALFHLSHTQNQMKMGDALRTCRQCIPNVIERWLIFALLHDMERKSSKNMSSGGANSLSATFRLDFEKAQKAHAVSRAYLQQAYLMLAKQHLDLERIMIFMDKAIENEEESREILSKLLKQYPQSTQVLREMGALLRDIYRDDDTATLMFTEANLIEEDTLTSQGQSHSDGQSRYSKRSSLAGSSLAGESLMSGGVKKMKKKRRKKRSGRTNGNKLTLAEDKAKLLPMFLPTIVASLMIMIVCFIVSFVLSQTAFSTIQTSATSLNEATNILVNFLMNYLYTMYFALVKESSDPTTSYTFSGVDFIPSDERLNRELESQMITMNEKLDTLYQQTKYEEHFNLMEYEYIQQIMIEYDRNGSGSFFKAVWSSPVNIIDLINTVSNINSDLLYMYDSKPSFSSWHYYIRANTPVNAVEAMKGLAIQYSKYAQTQSDSIVIAIIIMGIVSLVVPLVLTNFQFVITVRKLKKERHEVFLQICSVPKEQILKLKQRLDESEQGEDEESLTFGTMGSTNVTDATKTDQSAVTEDDGKPDNLKEIVEVTNSEEIEKGARTTQAESSGASNNAGGSSPRGGANGSGVEMSLVPHAQPDDSFKNDSNMMGAGMMNNGMMNNGMMNSGMLMNMGSNLQIGAGGPGGVGGTTSSGMLMGTGMGNMGANQASQFSLASMGQNNMAGGMLGMSPITSPSFTSPRQTPRILPHAMQQVQIGLASGAPSPQPGMMNGMNGMNGMNSMGAMNISGDLSKMQPMLQPQMSSFIAPVGSDRMGGTGMGMDLGDDLDGSSSSSTDMENGDSKNKTGTDDAAGAQGAAQANNANQQEMSEEDEEKEELAEQIKKISHFIPTSFWIRVLVGDIDIIIFGVAFLVISVVSLKTTVRFNNGIFTAGYREAMMCTIAVITINLGSPSFPPMIGEGLTFNTTFATNPVWTNLTHLSDDFYTQQKLLAALFEFYTALNDRANMGSDFGESARTHDDAVDELEVDKIVASGTKAKDLMMTKTDCLMEDKSICSEMPGRMKGVNGNFTGIEALQSIFVQNCIALINEADPVNAIILNTSGVQVVNSLIMYDLSQGLKSVRMSVRESQVASISQFSVFLYLFFILGIIFTFVGFFGCLFPTKTVLFRVATNSSKMRDLDPSVDLAERTGMGAAGWKDEYSCDCIRMDKEHQQVLLSLALVCSGIDPEIVIKDQLAEIKEGNDEEFKSIAELVEEKCLKKEASAGGNVAMIKSKQGADDKLDSADLKEKDNAILKAVMLLVKKTFAALSDEEHLIKKYKMPADHRSRHYSGHASLVKKLQTNILNIEKVAKKGKSLMASQAQQLMQVYVGWLTDHVGKVDRELTALLVGKAPSSEMERDVRLNQFTVPPSYSQFLESENASLQEKSLFEKMLKILHLNE